MSFNGNHMISLNNYEEWFIHYMDDELNAEQKEQVENFVLLHPHLKEELNLLLSTKLPIENVDFSGKENLHAASMKLNVIDEALLLYIDNELSAGERKAMEEKIQTNHDYHLQHSILQKTKLDASELLSYPDKSELYRYSERVVFFPVWMRIAVAVVLILFAMTFFLLNKDKEPASSKFAFNHKKLLPPKEFSVPVHTIPSEVTQQQQTAMVEIRSENNIFKKKQVSTETMKSPVKESFPQTVAEQPTVTAALLKIESSKTKEILFTEQATAALNNLLANTTVTSATAASYNLTEDPKESIVTDGNDKQINKTPARGFLRKVSRFIERRTRIGTVSADNEILIGAVALKLN